MIRRFVPLAAAVLAAGVSLGVLAAEVPRTPHVVFVTGDDEYRSEVSMPMLAQILEQKYGMRTSVAYARPTPQDHGRIEGLEALETADLMVMFTRYRAIPDDELNRILTYTQSGKPMVGFRTSTHAFSYPKGSPHEDLNGGFGLEMWGQKWIAHHGHTSTTAVTVRPEARGNPILNGVDDFPAKSWLYHVEPISGPATILLMGRSLNSEKKDTTTYPLTQPVAWTREHKGARVFFTTLGHPGDFEQPSMRRLAVNAILWALGREVPKGGADATPVTPYVAPESFDLSKMSK